jgi:hypothetical protein
VPARATLPLLRCSWVSAPQGWKPRPSHTPVAAACSVAVRRCSSCRATSSWWR